MNVPDAMVATTALGLLFGWPVWITALVIRHREKMKQIEYQRFGSPGMVEEVAQLRHEVAQLRETTTRFDMSYDAALDRLEKRMARMEGADGTAAESYPEYRSEEETVNVIGLRRS